jgi:peptidoglycan/LPS O-acetylase OafA/YrhL
MKTTVETHSSLGLRFLEPYQRITSTRRFIPEIDGLRFLAIFSVYIYHLAGDVLRHSPSGYAQSLESNGLFLVTQILNIGVPLFFIISGFILSLPFAEAHRNREEPMSLKKYFWRRVTRLEPPYFLCLLLFFILKIVTARGTAADLLPNLIASLFYVHNPVFGRPSDINFVAWSLEI